MNETSVTNVQSNRAGPVSLILEAGGSVRLDPPGAWRGGKEARRGGKSMGGLA